MPKIHGRFMVVWLDDSSSVLQDISNDVNSADLPDTTDIAETSGFGQTRKSYVTGLADNTVTINGVWNDDSNRVHAVLSGLLGGTTGYTLEIYPNGSSVSGRPKFSGESLVSNYTVTGAIGGAVTYTATLVPSGTAGFVWGTVA